MNGCLDWHPQDCGDAYCNDVHWDALVRRGPVTVLLRVTKHDSLVNRFAGRVYLSIEVEEAGDEALALGPCMAGTAWLSTKEDAQRAVVEAAARELSLLTQAVSALVKGG